MLSRYLPSNYSCMGEYLKEHPCGDRHALRMLTEIKYAFIRKKLRPFIAVLNARIWVLDEKERLRKRKLKREKRAKANIQRAKLEETKKI